ncbi:hypothetical protein NX059_010691 [Plenodomus lindquistii]|nr:hypothetical protein NX059_010691 [Plenodomus lindquistii]
MNNMRAKLSTHQRFTIAANEANDFYDAGRLDECIDKASALLEDPEIPHYHRMKMLILLGLTLGDWHEADACRAKAQELWDVKRRWHPAGSGDEWLDEYMALIAEELDELTPLLEAESPAVLAEREDESGDEGQTSHGNSTKEPERGEQIDRRDDREPIEKHAHSEHGNHKRDEELYKKERDTHQVGSNSMEDVTSHGLMGLNHNEALLEKRGLRAGKTSSLQLRIDAGLARLASEDSRQQQRPMSPAMMAENCKENRHSFWTTLMVFS